MHKALHKTPDQREKTSISTTAGHVASAGSTGIAFDPPPYGVDVVDSPLAVAQAKPQEGSDHGLHRERPGPPRAKGHEANLTGLPDQLKTATETLSGFSMNDVRVHYNSPAPARLAVSAYTLGSDIHIGPGQERHLPHEAWHVVQQKQGRAPATARVKGTGINTDVALEREADVMGERAVHRDAPPHSDPQAPSTASTPRASVIQCKDPDEAVEEFQAYEARMTRVLDEMNRITSILKKLDPDQAREHAAYAKKLQDRINGASSLAAWKAIERELRSELSVYLAEGMSLVSKLARAEGYIFDSSGVLAQSLDNLYQMLGGKDSDVLRSRRNNLVASEPRSSKRTKVKEGVVGALGSRPEGAMDATQNALGVGAGGTGLAKDMLNAGGRFVEAVTASSVGISLGSVAVAFGAVGVALAVKGRLDAAESRRNLVALDERYRQLKEEAKVEADAHAVSSYVGKKAHSKISRPTHDLGIGLPGLAANGVGLGLTIAGVSGAVATAATGLAVVLGMLAAGLLIVRIFRKVQHSSPEYIANTLIKMLADPGQKPLAEKILHDHLQISSSTPDTKELIQRIKERGGHIRSWAAATIVDEYMHGSPFDRAYAESIIGALGIDTDTMLSTAELIKKVTAELK